MFFFHIFCLCVELFLLNVAKLPLVSDLSANEREPGERPPLAEAGTDGAGASWSRVCNEGPQNEGPQILN